MKRQAPRDDREIDTLFAEHAEEMLRTARRYSISAADAEDAFQRALEKLITRRPAKTANLAAWLTTVTRNEALMIRRSQAKAAASVFEDVADSVPTSSELPEQSLIDDELAARRREALARLKPDHLRCLLLRAEGFGYNEISGATGFSVAKVQRSLWEGRRTLAEHVARHEAGSECLRIEPMLSTYADGASTPAATRDIELHLKGCLACKATLRSFRDAPTDVAALLPLGPMLAEPAASRRLPAGLLDQAQAWLHERLAMLGGGSNLAEVAFVKKASLATAVTLTALAGGAGVVKVSEPARDAGFVAAQPVVSAAARAAAPTVEESSPLAADAAEASIDAASVDDGEVDPGELLDAAPVDGAPRGGTGTPPAAEPVDGDATVPTDDGSVDEPLAGDAP